MMNHAKTAIRITPAAAPMPTPAAWAGPNEDELESESELEPESEPPVVVGFPPLVALVVEIPVVVVYSSQYVSEK